MARSTSVSLRTPAGKRLNALVAATALLLFWALATWLFEGRRETLLRPTATLDRAAYALVVNVGIGTALASWVLWRWVEPALEQRSALRATRRTLGWSALAFALGALFFFVQRGPEATAAVVFNAWLQVLPVSIAEVVVCWAVFGSTFEAGFAEHRRSFSVGLALFATAAAFGLYHLAHSAPFDTPPMILLLTIVGLATGAFFFATRDVLATILLHNWLAAVGVVKSLETNGLLGSYREPRTALVVVGAIAAVALLVSAAWLARLRFQRSIADWLSKLHASADAPRAPGKAALPSFLTGYVARAVGAPRGFPALARLEQRGEMRLTPAGQWLAFSAVQHVALRRPGFVWHARVKLPFVGTIEVVDALVNGHGRLEARLWGTIPIARASGPETARAQALRYLAELPWFPHALLENPSLSWHVQHPGRVELTLDETASNPLRVEWDETTETWQATGKRQRDERGEQPWTGQLSGLRALGGIRIPAHGEVRWDTPEGRFVYWRGDVTALELLAS